MQKKSTQRTFIIAVSGGVDSMVLLHQLVNSPGQLLGVDSPKLIVAHFEHGIRDDSRLDQELVHQAALDYNLEFVYSSGRLGSGASEDLARRARYEFLFKIMREYGAEAIVLAHHADDQIETAVFNILRGSSFRGIGALRSRDNILRPLLGMSKKQIYAYAKAHMLEWREDSTNDDLKYSRNYIRKKIIPRFPAESINKWSQIITNTVDIVDEVDDILGSSWGANKSIKIPKRRLFLFPKSVSYEIIACALRRMDPDIEVSRKLLEDLFWFAVSASVDKEFLLKNCKLSIDKSNFLIVENS